jgi:hypothetical protein
VQTEESKAKQIDKEQEERRTKHQKTKKNKVTKNKNENKKKRKEKKSEKSKQKQKDKIQNSKMMTASQRGHRRSALCLRVRLTSCHSTVIELSRRRTANVSSIGCSWPQNAPITRIQ